MQVNDVTTIVYFPVLFVSTLAKRLAGKTYCRDIFRVEGWEKTGGNKQRWTNLEQYLTISYDNKSSHDYNISPISRPRCRNPYNPQFSQNLPEKKVNHACFFKLEK